MQRPIPTLDAREVGTRAHVVNFRHARRWTQRKAADWWGVSIRQWRRYENGATPVPVPLLKRIVRGATL